MFQFNTYQPIILIAAYTSSPGKLHKVLYHLDRWRTRKLSELQFISIGVSHLYPSERSPSRNLKRESSSVDTLSLLQSAILAAATIGSFSWSAIVDAYWLASAFWYSSLILSILGILLAAQQVAVLQLLGKPPTRVHGGCSEKAGVRRFLPLILTEVRPRGSRTDAVCDSDSVGEWRPRWKMVFIWQCPTMFLSYSVCFFLAGLTLFVCTPLIRGDKWNTASDVSFSRIVGAISLTIMQIAVVYLATGAFAGPIFVFASFWIYHYVDLDHESRDIPETETDAEMLREYDRLHF